MSDFQKAVRIALISGFGGAVILPLIHECYANISKSFFTILIFALALTCGAVFCRFEVKSALVAITVFISVCGALGICIYLLIHPLAVSFLNHVSKYFRLTYIDSAYYYAKVLLAFIVVYIAYGVLHLIVIFIKKSKAGDEKVRTYIDNAFDD